MPQNAEAMIKITEKDIRDMLAKGATITSVPTPQMMQKQAITSARIQEECKAKEESIRTMTEDEMYTQIAAENMPVTETIKACKRVIKKAHPKASALIIGTEMNTKISGWVDLDLEIIGKEDDPIINAICECIKNCQRFKIIFENVLKRITKTFEGKAAEIAISDLQSMIIDLKKRNEPYNLIELKKAEMNRLRKEGKKDLAEIKQKEIDDIKLGIEKRRRRREQNIKNLEKAREANKRKREAKMKQQKQQQNQQPNFAKMAKQKRQQIAARQAEKKKKKASAGAEFSTTKSCSQLLTK